MDKHLTDEAKEFRRKRIIEIKPTMAPDGMALNLFYREFMRPFTVVADRLTQWENKQMVMACPACVEPYALGMIKVWKLHMTHEPDPLQNFAMLVTARCHHCKFEEMIPVEMPKVDHAERAAIKKAAFGSMYGMGSAGLGNLQSVGRGGAGGIMNANVWADKMVDAYNGQLGVGIAKNARDTIWEEFTRLEQQKLETELMRQQLQSLNAQAQAIAPSKPAVAPPPPKHDDLLDALKYQHDEAMRQADVPLAEKIYKKAREIMARKPQ